MAARSEFFTASTSRTSVLDAANRLVANTTGAIHSPLKHLKCVMVASFRFRRPESHRKQFVDSSPAIREAVLVDSHFVQQSQVKVCQRDRLIVLYVAPSLQLARSAPSEDDRQVHV